MGLARCCLSSQFYPEARRFKIAKRESSRQTLIDNFPPLLIDWGRCLKCCVLLCAHTQLRLVLANVNPSEIPFELGKWNFLSFFFGARNILADDGAGGERTTKEKFIHPRGM